MAAERGSAFLLKVTDGGEPALTRYRRVVIRVGR